MNPPALSMRGLSKAYPGGIVALREMTLDVAPGELVAVVGPSGCGKSTLLRLVAGLEGADLGEIRIEDRVADALSPRERDVALVFQTHSLFPHLNAFDNMAYGLRLRGTPAQEIAARVGEAARSLGIEALLTRRPAQLSGGERQRVALGRALVRRARLLLLDEPLSSLDAHLRADLRQVILRVHRLLGGVTLLVTHDQAEAMGLADRVAVLKEGALQQVGSPAELYERPANRFVAGFIGVPAASFFEGDTIRRGDEIVFESPELSFALDSTSLPALADHAGKRLVAGVRPEHWQWRPVGATGERDTARGRVEWLEWAGSRAFAHVRIGDTLVVALCPQQAPALGDEVHLRPDPSRVLLFDGAGVGIR
ncbi:MAG TPA: ABC transporter ATP-binding protein [Vicinamibacteria bacterium]